MKKVQYYIKTPLVAHKAFDEDNWFDSKKEAELFVEFVSAWLYKYNVNISPNVLWRS